MSSFNLLQRRFNVMGDSSPMFYDKPLELVRGEGVWLIGKDGRRYLDGYNNVPCVGHSHPKVVKAMAEQASVLNTHTRYLTEQIVSYAESLTATFTNGLDAVMFTCTGSEANELALRMARCLTGNQGIIVSDYSYHGNTATLAGLNTALLTSEPFSQNARAITIPNLLNTQDVNDISLADRYVQQVEEAISSLQDSGAGVAALLIDTLFANEGINRLPAGYLERITQRVHEAGGLVIVDEVQSGFARTGEHMWGYQNHEIVPDIVTLGKPMGNGFPLAGLVTTRDRVEAFGRANLYFNTFGGSPVAAAVGQAVLDVIAEENLQRNALNVGQQLHEALHGLAKRHSIIGDVRGKGLFFAIDLIRDQTKREPAGTEARALVNRMQQLGVLIGKIGPHDNILKIRPPLVFGNEHAQLFIDSLDRALSEL